MKHFCIGIDGGGTKTETVLCGSDGTVCKRVLLAGSNPNDIGVEKAVGILRESVRRAADDHKVDAIFAGVSGCTDGDNRARLSEGLAAAFPDAKLDVQSDIANVMLCHAEHLNDKCLAAICGTGSVVFASDGKGLHRVGGWGYLFDSAGSGYDIGRDCIAAILAEEDGIGPKTLLTDLYRERSGGGAWTTLHTLYKEGKPFIASFCRTVFEAYDAGDAVAKDILKRNFEHLGLRILQTASLYDCGDTVVLGGGIKKRRDVLERFILPVLKGKITVIFPDLPPVYGAAKGAAELVGREPEFYGFFLRTYQEK